MKHPAISGASRLLGGCRDGSGPVALPCWVGLGGIFPRGVRDLCSPSPGGVQGLSKPAASVRALLSPSPRRRGCPRVRGSSSVPLLRGWSHGARPTSPPGCVAPRGRSSDPAVSRWRHAVRAVAPGRQHGAVHGRTSGTHSPASEAKCRLQYWESRGGNSVPGSVPAPPLPRSAAFGEPARLPVPP